MSRKEASAPRLLPESWRVQLPVFEGPLDLLLHLIKINEVEITDIPVALICDQFHEYLGLMEELDLDIAGEYIYEAAILIHLKSRMLLPRPEINEEGVEEDPRQELVERLLEYQRLKEAAMTLAEVDEMRRGMWSRLPLRLELQDAEGGDDEGGLDIGDVSLFDLLESFGQVLERFAREHPEPMHMARQSYSVRGQLERLLDRMQPGRPYDLRDDLLALSCRAEAIAAFLAVLELGRLALVRIHQAERSAIVLYRTTRELLTHELDTILH